MIRRFSKHAVFILAGLATQLAVVAQAQTGIDRIRRPNGVDSGRITAVTPLGVTITKGTAQSTVPSENIEGLSFAGEPTELTSARNAVQAGRYQEALDSLKKAPADSSLREEILADIDFYSAKAQAQLALAGQETTEAAVASVRNFMTRRAKSYHIPEAIELLGDLLNASGQHANARVEYSKLAKAKSPYYQAKSALLVGRTWLAEGDAAKAEAEFDKVINSAETGPILEPVRLAATLERSISRAAAGQVDEAAKTIGEIIAKADADDAQLQARAYNALGDCYLKSGDNRAALFAFLHVDLLYPQDPDMHAKALHELIPLWKSLGKENRSQEAAQLLTSKYPNSRWAKQ